MTIKHKYVAIMAMVVMILMIITSFNTVDVSALTQKAKLNKKEMTVYVGKTAKLKMINTSKNVK